MDLILQWRKLGAPVLALWGLKKPEDPLEPLKLYLNSFRHGFEAPNSHNQLLQ